MARANKTLNPFHWHGPVSDPDKMVELTEFATEVALRLKAGAHIALFGARDTGKTSFLSTLARELKKSHGSGEAGSYTVIAVNLKRAISLPRLISCVVTALDEHPDLRVQQLAHQTLERLETETDYDFRLFKHHRKKSPRLEDDEHVLHRLLRELRLLDKRLVIVFDEAQRLQRVPGEPLATIQAALMDAGSTARVLFTGSVREALRMMLEDSNKPIFDETESKSLPSPAASSFRDFVARKFKGTDRAISSDAVEYLVNLTRAHPKRTQQLAGEVWNAYEAKREIGVLEVKAVYERLLADDETCVLSDEAFESTRPGDENAFRLLILLAEQGLGAGIGAAEIRDYGFGDRKDAQRAFKALELRGLVEQVSGRWRIVDPLQAEWICREYSVQPLYRYWRGRVRLASKLGREPMMDELVEYLGTPQEEILSLNAGATLPLALPPGPD